MTFCTAINCMDGRVQIPVIRYLQDRFGADYVDVISEPGPNRILAENKDPHAVASIEYRLKISVEKHDSVGIAVAGHYDCAGNPSSPQQQAEHTVAAARRLQKQFEGVEVIGLWVDENWTVHPLDGEKSGNA